MSTPEDFDGGNLERLMALQCSFLEYLRNGKAIYFDEDDLEDLFYFVIDDGDEELARKVLETGRKQHVGNLLFWYLEGVIYDEKGDYQKALDTFNAYPEREEPEWHCLCFTTYCHIGDMGKAKAAAEEIIHIGYSLNYYLTYITSVFLSVGKDELAKGYLKKAVALESVDAETFADLSRLALSLGEIDLAIRCADRVIQEEPYNAKAWLLEAHALLLQDKIDEALEKLEYVLAICPEHKQAMFDKVRVLIGLNKLTEAEEAIHNQLSLLHNQDYSGCADTLRSYLGDIAYLRGNLAEAREIYNTAYKKVDLMAVQLLHYAECKIQIHRWADAEKLLKESIEKEEGLVRSHEVLASLYSQRRRYKLAAAHTKICIQFEPNEVSHHIFYCIVLLESGNLRTAVKELQEATKRFPDSWELHCFMAIVMAMKDKNEAAADSLRRACEINPDARERFILANTNVEEVLRLVDNREHTNNDTL